MSTQIEILKKYELSVRGHLGQHLLIDPNLQRKITDLLKPSKGWILEIGPGLGALTAPMLERGFKVKALEIDPRFAEILNLELKAKFPDSLQVLNQDVLKTDLKKILPMAGKTQVISNLPYYITAPILFHLLSFRPKISRAIVMMQKEVAARVLASPGTKDYGRLSLGIRYAAEVIHAFDVPPGCFTPRPKVHSSVLVLEFRPSVLKPAEEKRVFGLIALAFSQRRKTFLRLLAGHPLGRESKEDCAAVFESLSIPRTARGEELLLKDYLALARSL